VVSESRIDVWSEQFVLTSSGHRHNNVTFQALLQHLMLVTAKTDFEARTATSIFTSLRHFVLRMTDGVRTMSCCGVEVSGRVTVIRCSVTQARNRVCRAEGGYLMQVGRQACRQLSIHVCLRT